jgi:protein arginine N-methyltransferase 1
MILGPRGIDSLLRLRRLRRWFKRNVLRQAWMADSFADPLEQQRMLVDKARCDAFREAIRRTVKPGDTVVDLGAGTGLLSFFALQAGARHVYAIEMSRITDVAAELIEANGFRDRVTLIRKNSKKVRLPERCDVLVSETLSTFCFDTENIIEYIADARKRFLKPGGRLIPESAVTFLLPFSSEAFGAGRLPARFYDLDYQAFRKKLFGDYFLVRASGKPFQALSQPAQCYQIDFWKDTQNPGKTFLPFRISAEGRLDGFLGWFAARLCEGVTISNSPYLPLTSWWQLYLPTLEQPQVRAGQTILLHLDPNIIAGEAEWIYRVQLASTESRADSASV